MCYTYRDLPKLILNCSPFWRWWSHHLHCLLHRSKPAAWARGREGHYLKKLIKVNRLWEGEHTCCSLFRNCSSWHWAFVQGKSEDPFSRIYASRTDWLAIAQGVRTRATAHLAVGVTCISFSGSVQTPTYSCANPRACINTCATLQSKISLYDTHSHTLTHARTHAFIHVH